jgi:hypothetical protein
LCRHTSATRANANRNGDDCIEGDTQAAQAAHDDEVTDGKSEAIE